MSVLESKSPAEINKKPAYVHEPKDDGSSIHLAEQRFVTKIAAQSADKQREKAPWNVDPESWAKALGAAVLDVKAGRKDARSLQRWLAPAVYNDLASQLSAFDQRKSSVPARALSARVYAVNAKTCEVAVTLWEGGRARAVAGRLVNVRGRWLATALTVI